MQGSESSPSKLGGEISTSLAHNSQQKGYQTNLSVQQPQQTQSQRAKLEAFGSTSSPLRDHHSFGSSSAHTTNASMVDWEITKLGDTEDQIEYVDHDGTDVVVAEEQVYTSLEKDMKWERSPEREELTRARMAERAAEWGLVLKSDVVTGRICGVTTRKSLGEYEYSAGDRSSGDRTSSGTSSTFPGTSTRTSMRKSRTSMRMSGTSMRTASGEALEDDKCSNTSSFNLPIISLELKDALSSFEQSFVVSDATTPEFPIMYASGGFFSMTGYSSQEVMGQNCRFLQGPGTDKKDVAKVREAVHAGKSFCGRILNYKKDGSTFWNLLTITPIKGDDGKVLKFIGMQVEVSKYTEGTKESAIRPNGLPESLIRYDARLQDKATESATELVRVFQKSHPVVQALNISDLQPVDGDGGLAALYAQKPKDVPTPGVQQAGARTGGTNQQFSQANILDGFQQTSRDGFPGIWSKSQLLNNVVVNNSLAVGDGAPQRSRRSSGFLSLLGIRKSSSSSHAEEEVVDTRLMMKAESLHKVKRSKEIRQGLDLATTLERIAKNFVITDPRLPDNPIIFVSDEFLKLTEYRREEVIGRNCRFLQGPGTDQSTVQKIRDAIDTCSDITVQLLNYTKTGRTFWNLFHLQAMRDHKGELQYFIGVQLDGSEYTEAGNEQLLEQMQQEGTKLVRETAEDVDGAVRELPDANTELEELWAKHSCTVNPKPHSRNSSSWNAITKQMRKDERNLGLKHFRPIKPLGCGDTGSVHLVELRETGKLFAMKAMDKSVMLNRNKVHRVWAERDILELMDHPFLPTLYASFQTKTHVCLITDFCPGGELFALLERQPCKAFSEEAVRFFMAEIIIALEYLHCLGVIYRDLKPENILLQENGHIQLTDFDLSLLTSSKPELITPEFLHCENENVINQSVPILLAEPVTSSNSFVGTEEYIAPEIIRGQGHSSAVDWWALGILMYEMLYGCTPFRGQTRQKTFTNALHKDLVFPKGTPVSLEARQVMWALLQRDPNQRLGSQFGAHDLKQHGFFRDINWPLIHNMVPPPLDVLQDLTTREAELAHNTTKDLDWEEDI